MIFCIISFISRFNLEKANHDFSIIFHSDTILFAAKLRLLFVPYLFFCGKYLDKSESQSRILHYLPFPVSPHPGPFSISPGWNLIFFRKKLFFLPEGRFPIKKTTAFARMGKFTISILAMAYFSPLEFSKNLCI